jgi:hypothetical protein
VVFSGYCNYQYITGIKHIIVSNISVDNCHKKPNSLIPVGYVVSEKKIFECVSPEGPMSI